VAVQERGLSSDDDFGGANEVVYYHQNTLSSVRASPVGFENLANLRFLRAARTTAELVPNDSMPDLVGVAIDTDDDVFKREKRGIGRHIILRELGL